MDRLIRWSVDNRALVVAIALAISVWGAATALRMPLDVLPDLTAPTVTVLAEARGLAPEEVESLVTLPIESVLNGATSVRRVRSSSGIGLATVYVEFEWGTDIFLARQIVSERLQRVAGQLPAGLDPPALAPVSSIMGEILFLAVQSDRHDPMELRDTADWVVRRRLLSVPGVAQVVPTGGDVREVHVTVQPERLLALDVTLDEVVAAVSESSRNTTGGFAVRGPQEAMIRALGRAVVPEDIAETVVVVRDGVPVLVSHVATVAEGPAWKRGEGSANARPAVVLAVQKQPDVNTLALTRQIDQALDEIQATLPEGMVVERELLRQADFISAAIDNVSVALRDGAIFVSIILFLFLANVRTTLISLVALPVSLLVSVLVMSAVGGTINTMTLGGLTIAIGALVDDAIIDVENSFRRLRENRALPPGERKPAVDVVFTSSCEIRNSIVFATLIVMLVFVPIFFLSGMEGRLLAPLGLAYLVAIFASLVVALTVTPALSAYLLPGSRALDHPESLVMRGLKRVYAPLLRFVLRRPSAAVVVAVGLLALALALLPRLGRSFLPEFNEGALTISAVTLPGTSLAESDRLGRRVEELLLSFPEVVSTARRTGRAELDEHAQDVNSAEIDVRLRPLNGSKQVFLEELRGALQRIPGVVTLVGQPLSHRIDHMLSGTRANIAIKIFGDDLAMLRQVAEEVRYVAAKVSGLVEVQVEQQVEVPQITIDFDRAALARFGLRPGALADTIETALVGRPVSDLVRQQRRLDVVVRYPRGEREDVTTLQATRVDTPTGARVPLGALAAVRYDSGPNVISRENVQRTISVMANVAGRDLHSAVMALQSRIQAEVALPPGFYVVYGGQFESEQEATRVIALLGVAVVAGIFVLLAVAFSSVVNALLIMVNLPLALIGGVVAVFLTDGVLSVASLIGFITLFGIASRNGIMLVSHFEHLRREEGAGLEEAVLRGAMERLSPILMTALTAGFALVPLVLAASKPGNEIQAPMGIVILGGLMTATALNLLLVPVLYRAIARRRAS